MICDNRSLVKGHPLDPLFLGSDCPDIISYVFSGEYDAEKQVLIDASDPTRYLSKRHAEELVSQLAGSFKPRSTVCLHLETDVLYSVLVNAILASDCIWTGTMTSYTEDQLEHHFRSSQTKYVIVAPKHVSRVQAAILKSGTQAEIIIFQDILKGHHLLRASSVEEMLLNGNGKSDFNANGTICDRRDSAFDSQQYRRLIDLLNPTPNVTLLRQLCSKINRDSTAVLMQTSGTTGAPKLAARTHRAMVMELHAIEDNNVGKDYEIRRLYATPITHGFGLPQMVLNSIRLGYPTYLLQRFSAASFADDVFRFGITETAGAPVMYCTLMSEPGTKSHVQSIRLAAFGGGPMPHSVAKQMLRFFGPRLRIVPVFGMTECGWLTTFKYPEIDIDEAKSGCVGRPMPGCEIMVDLASSTCDFEGVPTAEVLVRSPQLMASYHENAAATSAIFNKEGWLQTGDLGYLRDGKLYLSDRLKNTIKVNGRQVSSTEMEMNVTALENDVVEAAAVAAGNQIEEYPFLFVVRKESSDITAEAIKNHLVEKMSSLVKSTAVRFVDSIEKSPAGKILKEKLLQQLRDEGLKTTI